MEQHLARLGLRCAMSRWPSPRHGRRQTRIVDADHDPVQGIGTRAESSLHSSLKWHVSAPGDRFEVPVNGFVVDVVRGDTCIEIQTGAFRSMGRKLDALLDDHHVHIVHPVAVDSWIHRPDRPTRRSPQHGSWIDVLDELVSVPTLLDHPNLTIEVLEVQVDVIRVPDERARRGRGGWRTVDRRLRTVVSSTGLRTIADLAALVPPSVPDGWTTADVAAATGMSRRRAQQLAYVLRANDLVTSSDRSRAGVHHRWV